MSDILQDYDIDLLEKAVETASAPELTLMLYNGAIRFANSAIEKLEGERFEEAEQDIYRVGDIIQEFQITLNHDYEIAEPMYDLYQYMYRRLSSAFADENTSRLIVTEVRDMLREFRDTWKKAMEIALV